MPKKASTKKGTELEKSVSQELEKANTIYEEAGLKPSLSYLHGYPVKAATSNVVTFENNAELTVDDELEIGFKDKLPGLVLLTTIMSVDETVLIFGTISTLGGVTTVENEVRLYLPPGHYSLVDPRFQ